MSTDGSNLIKGTSSDALFVGSLLESQLLVVGRSSLVDLLSQLDDQSGVLFAQLGNQGIEPVEQTLNDGSRGASSSGLEVVVARDGIGELLLFLLEGLLGCLSGLLCVSSARLGR